MRKLFLSLATFGLMMSNCSNDEIENVLPVQSKTAIKAIMEEPITSRSIVDATSGVFTWADGDVMKVNTTGEAKDFTYDSYCKAK